MVYLISTFLLGEVDLIGMTGEQQKSYLANFTRAIFVRNPHDRLLSAYNHLMLDPRQRNALITYLPKFKGKNAPEISFSDFVQALKNGAPKNVHWQTVGELCSPCDIDYNFVGSLENFEEDAKYLLKNILRTKYTYEDIFDSAAGPNYKVQSKHPNVSYHDQYRQLSSDLKKFVAEYYMDDAKAFGYNMSMFSWLWSKW